MLIYLVMLLDDTSVSYCHYETKATERHLMPLGVLQRGIVWAMKENLNIQFVYPPYELPEGYKALIETVDHTKIGPTACGEQLDVTIVDQLSLSQVEAGKCYVWRCTLAELKTQQEEITKALSVVGRLNIVLMDIPTWREEEFADYREVLDALSDAVLQIRRNGGNPQFNLLTDRTMLNKMNNCNAGDTTITLAPDGHFYLCPAFYPDGAFAGSLDEGLIIKNQQLLRLDHAPICRKCDAFQCRRCIWMNSLLTTDMNTPSHEQCVAAHLERNASRKLLSELKTMNVQDNTLQTEIPEIDYLDPFDKYNRWKL